MPLLIEQSGGVTATPSFWLRSIPPAGIGRNQKRANRSGLPIRDTSSEREPHRTRAPILAAPRADRRAEPLQNRSIDMGGTIDGGPSRCDG
jgi:hypothetical protein